MGAEETFLQENNELVPEYLHTEQKSNYDLKLEELKEKLRTKKTTLSFSSLKAFGISPKHFVEYKLTKKETKAMDDGKIRHMLMLEPHKFEETYVVIDKAPTTDLQTAFCNEVIAGTEPADAYKLFYSKGTHDKLYEELKPYIDAKIAEKECIDQKSYQEAKLNVDTLLKQPMIEKFLMAIEAVEVKVELKYNGWKVIGYVDAKGQGFKLDLKFMADASPEKVEREINKMKYYMQGGIYIDADPEEVATRYFILAFDKNSNFSVTEIDRTFILYGQKEYKYLINKLEECVKDDRFHESYNFFDKHQRTVYKPKWVRGFDTDNDEEED